MKKKGFTLIELLAVIVILAVIALIVTPIILNVIEKGRVKDYLLKIRDYVVNYNIALKIAKVTDLTFLSEKPAGIYSIN